MNQTKVVSRRSVIGLLAVGSAALVAACGGAASPTAAPAKPTEAPKPAATTAPAAGGSSPAAGATTAGAGAASPTTGTASPAAAAAATKPAAAGAASPAAGATTTGAAPAGTAPSTSGQATAYPAYYPSSYAEVVEGSKKEGGKLLVYSIMSKANWAPVQEAFKKLYPWIEVDAPDLDSATIFDRYYSEGASNARTADMIMTSSPEAWPDFIKKGEGEAYKSPEDDKVPGWSKQGPGVYTISSDPFFFTWNKKLLTTPPKTMAELADMVTKDAAKFTPGKVVSYEEANSSGLAANWVFAKKNGQDKLIQYLTAVGKTKPKLESSGGRMVDATIAGETMIGYFVSAITVLPQIPKAEAVLGYGMIGDGTPTLLRAMSVTKKAKAPNSAKLLLDFTLSQPGQIAWSAGGLTVYRDDVKDQAKVHLAKIAGDVGQDNILSSSFDPDLADKDKREAFRAKLKSALRPA